MVFLCGFGSGLVTAIILNPWDKALYLSVVEKRKFLHKANFVNPYGGVLQTALQRSLSSGIYFPLETKFQELTKKHGVSNKLLGNFLAGQATGFVTAVTLNPLSVLRFRCWGTENSVLQGLREIARSGGPVNIFKAITKGTFATLCRDVIFGVTFCCLRSQITREERRSWRGFVFDLSSAALATIGSSPFNYCRNSIYYTAADQKPPSIPECLRHVSKCDGKSGFQAFMYLQNRLRIGWGTARVAFGMALSSQIYEMCLENRKSLESD